MEERTQDKKSGDLSPAHTSESEAVYILITQCLQNDFFLNPQCRLCLPEREAGKLLVGKAALPQSSSALTRVGNRFSLQPGFPQGGPLGLFLRHAIGGRLEGKENGTLHVINIRDWHTPGERYDRERRLYGPHCEENTWGAAYIDGLAEYLHPKTPPQQMSSKTSTVQFYEVLSSSVFDFKPEDDPKAAHADERQEPALAKPASKYQASQLEDILDKILPKTPRPVYVAVIGVYTDIKVKTLLIGLRTRYDIPNLAVSDTLTASPSLERHLGALDFAQKVLWVDVIHGVNDLIRFLGGEGCAPNESNVVPTERFADYASYFQDKQNVLAYQHEKLDDYLALTKQRAEKVYETIRSSNVWLMRCGLGFLAFTLLGPLVAPFIQLKVPTFQWNWTLSAVTGGLGTVQLLAVFFSHPMERLTKNLSNFTTLRMLLESHSLKIALARFHLTTPKTLKEMENGEKQIRVLLQQLQTLNEIDSTDFRTLDQLGFRTAKADAAEKKETTKQDAQPGGPAASANTTNGTTPQTPDALSQQDSAGAKSSPILEKPAH